MVCWEQLGRKKNSKIQMMEFSPGKKNPLNFSLGFKAKEKKDFGEFFGLGRVKAAAASKGAPGEAEQTLRNVRNFPSSGISHPQELGSGLWFLPG